MANDNGHASPAMTAALKVRDACERTLTAAQVRVAELNTKLEHATTVMTLAAQQIEALQRALAEDDPSAAAALHAAQRRHAEVEARAQGIRQLLRAPVQAVVHAQRAYRDADAAVGMLTNVEALVRARKEFATSKHALDQAQMALTLAEDRFNKADRVMRTLETAERDVLQNMQHARKHVPVAYERVRQGF
jgi:chromosome segregation ATPase